MRAARGPRTAPWSSPRVGSTVGAPDRVDGSPGAALADIAVDDAGARPELVPHGRLPVADPRGGGRGSRTSGGSRINPEAVGRLLGAGLAPDAVAATDGSPIRLANVDRLIVVGSGADRTAARELVLKVEEGTHLPAAMRDLETMLHGHLAGIDDRTGVVLVLTGASAARGARGACRRASSGRRASSASRTARSSASYLPRRSNRP